MKKKTIWTIAIIMGFSFLALLYLQLSYIQEMVNMKKEQFDESVNRALYQASRNLELNETLRYLEKNVNETERKANKDKNIRELTGGMYFGEKYQDNDKAYDTDIYYRPEIERILKVAFDFAMKRKKHLTVVDKANVLASSRLWRQIAKEMEPQYPEVTTDYMFIDNASMRVLTEPRFFDVIVTENTFGDILTDETSCITGSMGLQPSASLGEHTPLFEPVHGSWPQAAGKNIANPVAQILSAAMLLEHFNLKEEGALVRKAVDASLDANVRTPEIQVEGGKQYGTTEVGKWIVDYIKNA